MSIAQADIHELIDLMCTAEQIGDLLGVFKDEAPDVIRLSGRKADLIESLRTAAKRTIIPADRGYALLQDSEENGNQHIFYYKPKNETIAGKCRNGTGIAVALFGSEWESMGYPRLKLKMKDYIWSDFRLKANGKKTDWLAKVYGHEVTYRLKSKKFEGGMLVKRYKPIEDRVVCLARWNHPSHLELRVSRAVTDSRKTTQKRLARLWDMLTPALSRDDFEPWDLEGARRRILADRAKYAKEYRVNENRFGNREVGFASILPPTEEESPHKKCKRPWICC